MNKQVILFFYMNDIIILFHFNYQDDFKKLVQQLIKLSIKLYNLRQIGSVKWFLGICVECLLTSSQLYLVQDAFINKVCTDGKYPSMPLSSTLKLVLYNKISELSNTKTYQCLVGNLAYIKVMM
jgi:hypothetical protein